MGRNWVCCSWWIVNEVSESELFCALPVKKNVVNRPQEKKMGTVTVFFDGGCPLCRREIGHYQKLTALEPIQWVDITVTPNLDQDFGLSPEAAMRRFHVLDPQGNLKVGAVGFLRLWQSLPGYRYLARLLILSRCLPVMNILYEYFASWHHARRCRSGACSLPGHGE